MLRSSDQHDHPVNYACRRWAWRTPSLAGSLRRVPSPQRPRRGQQGSPAGGAVAPPGRSVAVSIPHATRGALAAMRSGQQTPMSESRCRTYGCSVALHQVPVSHDRAGILGSDRHRGTYQLAERLLVSASMRSPSASEIAFRRTVRTGNKVPEMSTGSRWWRCRNPCPSGAVCGDGAPLAACGVLMTRGSRQSTA